LSGEDKLNLIGEICDTLTAQELRRVRTLATDLVEGKLEEAKKSIVAEMKSKLDELGLSFEEVMEIQKGRRTRRDRGSTLPPKYRSPEGFTWSGRGAKPTWLKEREAAGENREDYRIPEEG
jgi:DNA-binding protein H-NS